MADGKNPVVDNAARGRFELSEGGHLAFANYRRDGDVVTIPHVEAAVPLRGTGAAGRLMQGVAAHARRGNFRIVPTCPYAVAWFRKHPDYKDTLA